MYNYLYMRRGYKGLTQQALAERAGISRRTVCSLENGGYPSMRVAARLCRALECEFEEVFPLELSL